MFDKMKTSSQNKSILSGLLVKTSHQKVLALFLADPVRRLYGTEISKKICGSIGQTSKILSELLSAGVIEKEKKGKTDLYAIVELTSELRLFKTLNTVLNIAPLVNRLKPMSKMIILYGSCVMGTNIVESDLDLFIVGSEREQIVDAIARFSPRERYGYAEIKPVITNSAGWAKLETDDPLFFNELQRGIMLFEKRIDESRL
jgi:hypothetical protein